MSSRPSVADTNADAASAVGAAIGSCGEDVKEALAIEPHKPDGKPKYASGGCDTIKHAKAQRESKKGEDASIMINDNDGSSAAFAVFDGHSGQRSGKACAASVCQRIMKGGPPFTAEAISSVMWQVDEEIGTQHIRDGATAQILMVEKIADKLKGTFAWCGDSSAVVTNCTGGEGAVHFATASHTAGPDHQGGGSWQQEKAMLEGFKAVREAIEAKEGIDTIKQVTTAEMVADALSSTTGKPAVKAEVDLLVKAFRRGKIIADTTPEGAANRKRVRPCPVHALPDPCLAPRAATSVHTPPFHVGYCTTALRSEEGPRP